MRIDLRAHLPLLVPRAIAWAKECAADIDRDGKILGEHGQAIARAVGVTHIDRIRLKIVDYLPLPADPLLRKMAVDTGLIGPNMVGMTFGHSIYICNGHLDVRLLSHECRHVYQYEKAGSIEAFIPTYLQQIADHGYDDAPYEVDAYSNELNDL